jgi:hypothetical protein
MDGKLVANTTKNITESPYSEEEEKSFHGGEQDYTDSEKDYTNGEDIKEDTQEDQNGED